MSVKMFEESDRYSYPLTANSVVMDVGCHRGQFSRIILDRFGCDIFSYEPIEEFYLAARKILLPFPHSSSVLVKYGLGRTTRTEKFIVKGDMSGAWADQGPIEDVHINAIGSELNYRKNAWAHLAPLTNPWVDLIKINIEGGEMELLEAILDEGLTPQFRNIQVQFHGITALDPVRRRDAIRERLRSTHEEMYCEPFVWEGWRIK